MASTNFVDNSSVIYASWLNNVNEAVYNGNFQATTISPANLICNGSVSGTGFNGLVNSALGSPAAIGNGTPNTGAFTTLSATTLSLTNALGVAYGGTGSATGANLWRNKIINGAMQIAQRGATYALTNSVAYGSVDRWAVYQVGTANGVANQVASGLTGFQYALKIMIFVIILNL